MKFIKILLVTFFILLSGCNVNGNICNTEIIKFDSYTEATVECSPIDKSLDCENILLERAETLHEMMYDYLNHDESKLVYSIGEVCSKEGIHDVHKVFSDEIKSYVDFKKLFSTMIYEPYIDYICYDAPGLLDIDGELYYHENISGGPKGVYETWYLGYEVTDYSIIGHFASLEGVPASNEEIFFDEEYLNDEENYHFYDITIHNTDGKYVLTSCSSANTIPFNVHSHGMFYNSGKADRTLITNEKVKPVVTF